jgi:hypothetical protein
MKQTKPNNYLILSIVSILFFWPLAIVAIINALKVNKEYEKGNYDLAEKASKKAKKFAIISIVISVVISLFIAVIGFYAFGVRISPVFIILLLLGIALLFVLAIEKYTTPKSKPIVTILLWGLIAFLGYQTFMSVYNPILFNQVKEKRYAEVIKNLVDIRDAQLAYREINGKYTNNHDSLVNFIENGQFTLIERRDSTVIDEEKTKLYGGVEYTKEITITDTLGFVPVRDSLFKTSTRYTKMRYVPFAKENFEFTMNAGQYGDKEDDKIPVFEAFSLKKDILHDQNDDYVAEESQAFSVDEINGDAIRVGSMEEVKTNGNWPKLYDTKKQ